MGTGPSGGRYINRCLRLWRAMTEPWEPAWPPNWQRLARGGLISTDSGEAESESARQWGRWGCGVMAGPHRW